MTVRDAWSHFEVNMLLPRARAEQMGWRLVMRLPKIYEWTRQANGLTLRFTLEVR